MGSRQSVAGGQRQAYQRGNIWYSAASGAWETHDGNESRYLALGGPDSFLGFPVTGESAVTGGVQQMFQGGNIWWSPKSGSWETRGGINSRFITIGATSSTLQFPTSPEQPVPGGVRQQYLGGNMWYSPASGPWETHDGNQTRWFALGGIGSFLGFPVTGEMKVADGVQQMFQGGNIWWSPRSGSWETQGGINSRFITLGSVSSWLGFPTSPEQPVAGGVRQQYLGGNMWYSPASGPWETHGSINADYLVANGPSGWYRFPVGPEYAYLGGVRQDYQGGALLWNVQPVLDATYASVSQGDVWASWRPGCPVGPESLTLVRLNYWGFDNLVHRGEIIVRSDLAGRVASVFDAALADRYPIRQMWRTDYFGGDDPTAMANDDTSGFNCRQVTGGTGISPHSYGIAIDVNTVENPYYAGGRWWPNTDYVDRNNVRRGMLFSNSAMTTAFAAQGYSWGGSYLDYQHFEFVG